MLDENLRRNGRSSNTTRPAGANTSHASIFAPYKTKPPKAISKTALAAAAASAGIVITPAAHTAGSTTSVTPVASNTTVSSVTPAAIVDGLVIQVTPHHNG